MPWGIKRLDSGAPFLASFARSGAFGLSPTISPRSVLTFNRHRGDLAFPLLCSPRGGIGSDQRARSVGEESSTERWLRVEERIKIRFGCPISRVLCEKWGFWLIPHDKPEVSSNVHPSHVWFGSTSALGGRGKFDRALVQGREGFGEKPHFSQRTRETGHPWSLFTSTAESTLAGIAALVPVGSEPASSHRTPEPQLSCRA